MPPCSDQLRRSRRLRRHLRAWAAVLAMTLPRLTGLHLQAAEESLPWRIFRASDGLAESFSSTVTLGHRGAIWTTHRESGLASRLDGYTVSLIPAPAGGTFPISESRSGQVWSIYEGGVAEFRSSRWLRHPQTDVHAENLANPLRNVRPVPLLPADRNHVLLLLPDRLLSFHTRTNLTRVVLHSNTAEIGRFNDMIEDAAEDLWISADRGVIRVPGPLRRLTADSPFDRYPLPADLAVIQLEHPLLSPQGGMTLVGDASPEGHRGVVRFNAGQWELICTTTERVRAAWQGVGGSFWLLTRGALLRWEHGALSTLAPAEIPAGQYYDVAVGTNGFFWLATSEGLACYSPPAWRLPAGPSQQPGVVVGIHEDESGMLGIAHAGGLITCEGTNWTAYAWPPQFDLDFPQVHGLQSLRTGEWLTSANQSLCCFTPASKRIRTIQSLEGRKLVRMLGSDTPGTALLLTEQDAPDGKTLAIERFDGTQLERLISWNPSNQPAEVNAAIRLNNGTLCASFTDFVAFAENNQWRRIGPDPDLSGGRLTCIAEPNPDRLWAGTTDRVLEFDGVKWKRLASGFERVNAIVRQPDGAVWVATSSGLFRNAEGSWAAQDVEEGLPSPTVYTLARDRSGTLWAGTTRGFSRLYPRTDQDPPRTSIATSPLRREFTATENVVLTLSGADRWRVTATERLLYSYRLDQGAWVPFGPNTTTTLTNVASGAHRLEARSMDRQWNMDPLGAVFEFTVILPWHREPRILLTAFGGLVVALALAWLAVNRHLRLLRSYAEVEQVVRQRTRELEEANAALLHSQKMRALGTLAAGVAHDFNNILSIIRGSAQIIESNLDDKDKIRIRTNRIKMVVDQGGAIVRSILGLARPGQESLPEADLDGILREAARIFEDKFGTQVTVRYEPASGLPRLQSSPDLIQQMLLNLAINGVDAMNGKGTLVLRTSLVTTTPPGCVLPPSHPGPLVGVDVIDHGCGIPPETLSRIFEPFYTTKALSSRRGTGLGLTMVYEFARHLGYGLVIRSIPEKGTAFTILIPVEKGPALRHQTVTVL